MAFLLLILKFFGGLILFFIITGMIGHFLKLDKHYEYLQNKNKVNKFLEDENEK